eukprot:4118552-Prymnesium_polylepis.1
MAEVSTSTYSDSRSIVSSPSRADGIGGGAASSLRIRPLYGSSTFRFCSVSPFSVSSSVEAATTNTVLRMLLPPPAAPVALPVAVFVTPV